MTPKVISMHVFLDHNIGRKWAVFDSITIHPKLGLFHLCEPKPLEWTPSFDQENFLTIFFSENASFFCFSVFSVFLNLSSISSISEQMHT